MTEPRFVRVLALLACSGILLAQSNIATITGIVTDQSGAPVPNCSVVITNADTGVVTRTQSNAAGVYIAPSLIPGPYTVAFQAAGFNKREVQSFALRTGQQMRLDATLEVGNLIQNVEVVAQAELMERESAEMSQTLTSTEIRNLPVNNRSPYALMQFVSGISAIGDDPSALSYADRVSINGSRSRGNSFVIDGASSLHIGGIGERIGSIEAFSEAKVLTNTYSAEYGRTAGGVMVFSVKNGTNEHHGSAYEYLRNDAFNAGNWQDNAAGRSVATRRIHQFGGTLGGPVPGFGNKLFYFGSYEGERDHAPTARLRTLPTAALKNGDFSAFRTVISDPLTRQPFANNIIPRNRIDPAAQKVAAMMPDPNATGTLNTQYGIFTSNWYHPGKVDWARNFGIGRADYNLTDNDRFFVTFAHINERRDEGQDLPNALNNIRGATPRDMRRLTINYTRILTPGISNELMAHAMRDNRTQHPWFGDFDAQRELGIQRTPAIGMPTLQTTGGFGNFGWSRFEEWISQPAGINETMTWQKGRHTMRFGGQLFQTQFWYISAGQVAGVYNFTGETTGLGAAGRNNPLNAWGDLMLGAVKTSEIPVSQIPVNRVAYNLGLFFNDTWKVSQKVNLNLGLRYEGENRQIVKNNIYSRVDIKTGELLVAGRNASRNLNMENDWFNLSPRLGVAWSLNDKTVIRSGLAVFRSNFWIDNGEMVSYPGWTGSKVFVGPGVGRAQDFRLSDGMPLEGLKRLTDPFEELANANANRTQLPVGAVSYGATYDLPWTTQWNLGVQRSLPWNTVLEVAYVASHSGNQSRSVAANNPGIEASEAVNIRNVRLQDVRPFTQYPAFNAVFFNATADYHSMQMNITRRFSSGFSLDGSFTWSKNTDTASGFADSNQIPWQFPEIEHALSSIDRPRSLTIGWVWDLPVGRGRRFVSSNRVAGAILGGFKINGALSASDGLPFTITQRLTNLVLAAQRANVIDTSNLSGKVDEPSFSGAARTWLIPANDPRFPFTPSGNLGFGNLGRNTGREPGFVNLNLGVFRNVAITERFGLEFRAEAYNALNHVNYREPSSTNINDATYGLITAAAPARQIQLGLRLSF
ncbi:MAG TPA: carboxypeptidase regulatory-like domain-containing protein [Bryobacteraceae bacterium]|nr:carboxypeptidase regulatory-like domain-containing protein [Bryobacteraceae bacterium]